MKKLFPIYGHISPLIISPTNGKSKNAFTKSITLSQKFQDLNFSLFHKISGIISIVDEFIILAEKYRRTVTGSKIAGMYLNEILGCNHSGSKETLCLITVNSIPVCKANNSIPGIISMVKNKFQNTF